MERIHTVRLSSRAERVPSGITVRRNDFGADVICAEISDIADLSEYKDRTFMIFKHGGTVTEEYACEVDKNKVSIRLPDAVVSMSGFFLAEIHFYEATDQPVRFSTSTFSFNVMPDIDPSDSSEAEEAAETLYSKIAQYCAAKINEIGAMRFSIVDGHLTVMFSDSTTYDLGVVKGRDAVTQKGTVTLYSGSWDVLTNTYTLSLSGIGQNGTAFFKPYTLPDKTALEDADCFITVIDGVITVIAETVPNCDITLEYVLIGG